MVEEEHSRRPSVRSIVPPVLKQNGVAALDPRTSRTLVLLVSYCEASDLPIDLLPCV